MNSTNRTPSRAPAVACPAFAAALLLAACQPDGGPVVSQAGRAEFDGRYIDAHFHAHPQSGRGGNIAFDMDGAARAALRLMDANGIAAAIIMPPPFPPGRDGTYDYAELRKAVRTHPDRFAFLGGGGTLNPMIHATPAGSVTPDIQRRFEAEAEAVLAAGARGFGEMTALHFSFHAGHPFEEIAPDHPLFLRLADIAARHRVPIDLHVEAVPEDMPVPDRVRGQGAANPPRVHANIAALKRLLSHNPAAAIIWAHAGWDNTGGRTPALMGELLAAHPNLYMSLKFRRPGAGGATNPLDGNASIRPGWLRLMERFPDRFLMATDTHVYPGARRNRFTARPAQALLKGLPPPVARAIAYDNARRLFRLGADG
ncbi:MAG: amidohydrolase family protein [Alphaproteobacteria bacterium]|nr:amidohydrolase family protein [Alphaproteobacteria bacterium]